MDPICRVRDHFTRQPIFRDLNNNPTAYFGVTDFTRPLNPCVIDDMAGCMAEALALHEVDVLVSIADRSGGSLTYSVAEKTGLPFTLANWYPVGSPGEIEIGKCAGFSGTGVNYLNGLRKNKNVAVVMDVLKSGKTAAELILGAQTAGCKVVAAVFGCEIVEAHGREFLAENLPTEKKGESIEIISLVKVHMRGECTKMVKDDDCFIEPTASGNISSLPAPRVKELRALDEDTTHLYLDRIASAFLNIPIHNNPHLSYPYSFFQLTDFLPCLTADSVNDMADLCVKYGDFDRCDIIVSEADRGGGPLAQAVAMRVGKPYVLANWYASGEGVGASSNVAVGFSGEGSIVVNGIERGDRCIFVDDMLSSGGTAEGVLNSIVKLGGIPIEGVFVSEKLYPPTKPNGLPIRKGLARLKNKFPHLVCTTLVQFIAQGERTLQPNGRVGNIVD